MLNTTENSGWLQEKRYGGNGESAICLSKKDHKVTEKSKLLIEESTEALQKAERKSGHQEEDPPGCPSAP